MTDEERYERRPSIYAKDDGWVIHVLYRGNEEIARALHDEPHVRGQFTPEFAAWAEANMPDYTVSFHTVNMLISTRCENGVLAFRMRFHARLSKSRGNI